MSSNKLELNNVKNRFLPITQSVIRGLESEPKIKDFEIIKELGFGSFGRVFLAKHRITKAQYAIKVIDKKNKTNIEEKPYFRRELEVMYKIHHPNVVKLFGHFEDNNYCYFIMEYINKGNVYSLLTLDKKRKLSPQVVASIIKDVTIAVYFLHNMNPPIIHRDIKPENVLLNEGLIAKLTDFGWSNYILEEKERRTVCGTPIYLAPEIIKEKAQDERVDIWCIGVLLFELITGIVPFQGNDIDTLKSNILHLKISWPKDINPDAKNLISKILKLEPNQRISLKEILQHPFILKYFPEALNCLILPDNKIHYKTFIISKDDPKTWNPILENSTNKKSISCGKNSKSYYYDNTNSSKKEPIDRYTILQEKYENLKKDYYKYKSGNESLNEIEELKKKIKEKNEKIDQLMKGNQNMNKLEEEEKELKNKCNDLEHENYDLRNQVIEFEKQIKDLQSQAIEDKLNDFTKKLDNDEQDYCIAFEELKKYLDTQTRQNLEEVLRNKDREIEKYKQEEKERKEKEKIKYTSLINKYDQTLSWVERENEELKRKIKELESKLPKK